MLFDIEKSIKRLESGYKSDEYRDLVYDLESFIIDLVYDNEDEYAMAERQSYLGKVELAGKVFNEREEERVFCAIRPILSELGVHESVKGFRLLEKCVVEAARNTCENGFYIMKNIYPEVAKQFCISAHNCERLCRYAVKQINPTTAFARRYPFFEELTHRTYENVTVKELVDILVRYVICRLNFRTKK